VGGAESVVEVDAALRRRLLNDPPIAGFVQTRVYKRTLMEPVPESGQAIVVAMNGGWAPPELRQHAENPLVTVRCYADPDRDVDGTVVRSNAEDKARATWRQIDRLIHGTRGETWGAVANTPGLRIVSCERWSEPIPFGATDQHGRSTDAREPLGDIVYVYCSYAVQTFH
jgi:hypothetical protein